ncbi:YjeJ family protein, partial [Salmonella enterica]
MALTIKGLNTGVIRHNDKFIALALKVKSLRNKETLLFFPVLALRDLLIGLEHRLYLQHSLPEQEQEKRQKAKSSHVLKMHENIPAILREELENADVNQRVESLALSDNTEKVLTFTLKLHNGSHLDLQVGEWQVEVLVMAIIHAINNAEMRELALRISSMLD